MTSRRRVRAAGVAVTLACLFAPAVATAQEAASAPERAQTSATGTRWTGAAELALYIIPDEENYLIGEIHEPSRNPRAS